ncbi:hypothetical protein J1605_021937 [Eschrichtius robustus]|uniref:Uncharacterized protein n=1 Tax=Eschrichtius robustus TaxID=9764 RepID=A0AB34HES9_ESCRO|nr:hypothetical protein J1605_021937 [Eschrichtius robustus]
MSFPGVASKHQIYSLGSVRGAPALPASSPSCCADVRSRRRTRQSRERPRLHRGQGLCSLFQRGRQSILQVNTAINNGFPKPRLGWREFDPRKSGERREGKQSAVRSCSSRPPGQARRESSSPGRRRRWGEGLAASSGRFAGTGNKVHTPQACEAVRAAFQEGKWQSGSVRSLSRQDGEERRARLAFAAAASRSGRSHPRPSGSDNPGCPPPRLCVPLAPALTQPAALRHSHASRSPGLSAPRTRAHTHPGSEPAAGKPPPRCRRHPETESPA